MKAYCVYCKRRICVLLTQDFVCVRCKIQVHKRRYKSVNKPSTSRCQEVPVPEEQSENIQPIRSPVKEIPSDKKERDFPDEPLDFSVKSLLAEDTNEPSVDLNAAHQQQNCLGDFKLNRLVGMGTYGKVFMVEHKETKRIYAMKVIEKKIAVNNIEHVFTEKSVLETASNYPFLVGLHSCFQTLSKLCFVTEFVRGGDFFSHIHRQKRLPEDHAKFYAAEISLALNFLHHNDIIFRDLKLENVLMDHEGHIKITDYGLCKVDLRPGYKTSSIVGTTNYMAPEVLLGLNYDFSVDWWSLGVLLFELLVGRSPFDMVDESNNFEQHESSYLRLIILRDPINYPEILSDKAINVLNGFLTKNPAYRLGSHSPNSFSEITEHDFFQNIDWSMLEQKQVPPPYIPPLDSEKDVANFPLEFTESPVNLTSGESNAGEIVFDDFDYVNPLLVSMENCR